MGTGVAKQVVGDFAQEEGESLTLNRAIALTLGHHRGMQAIYEQVPMARAELVEAGLLKNPILEISGKRHGGEAIVEVGLIQCLLDLFMRSGRIKGAGANLCAIEAEVRLEMMGILHETIRAFYAVDLAGKRLSLMQARLETYTLIAQVADRLFEAGNITKLDQRAHQIACLKEEQAFMEVKESLRMAQHQLSLSMGVAFAPVDGVELSAPKLKRPWKLKDLPLKNSLALQASSHRIEEQARLAGVKVNNAVFEELALGFDGEKEADGLFFSGAQFSFSIPFFNRGQAARAHAKARARAMILEHGHLKEKIAYSASMWEGRYEAAFGRLGACSKKLLPRSAEQLEETLLHYNAMQVSVIDLLKAKADQLEIGLKVLELWGQCLEAQTEMEVLAAGGYHD